MIDNKVMSTLQTATVFDANLTHPLPAGGKRQGEATGFAPLNPCYLLRRKLLLQPELDQRLVGNVPCVRRSLDSLEGMKRKA